MFYRDEDGAGWWFRFGLGWGLSFTDHRVSRPLFSCRNVRRKRLHIGPYCFKILKPTRRP